MNIESICLNESQTRELLRLLREGALGTGPAPAMYLTQRELMTLLNTSSRTLNRRREIMGSATFSEGIFLVQENINF